MDVLCLVIEIVTIGFVIIELKIGFLIETVMIGLGSVSGIESLVYLELWSEPLVEIEVGIEIEVEIEPDLLLVLIDIPD